MIKYLYFCIIDTINWFIHRKELSLARSTNQPMYYDMSCAGKSYGVGSRFIIAVMFLRMCNKHGVRGEIINSDTLWNTSCVKVGIRSKDMIIVPRIYLPTRKVADELRDVAYTYYKNILVLPPELSRVCYRFGIYYRGTDYRYAIGHEHPMCIDKWIDVVSRTMKKFHITELPYLVTESEDALQYIAKRMQVDFMPKERYDESLFTGKLINEVPVANKTKANNDTLYVYDIIMLSRCDYIISQNTSGLLMAAILGRHKYIKVIRGSKNTVENISNLYNTHYYHEATRN